MVTRGMSTGQTDFMFSALGSRDESPEGRGKGLA